MRVKIVVHHDVLHIAASLRSIAEALPGNLSDSHCNKILFHVAGQGELHPQRLKVDVNYQV